MTTVAYRDGVLAADSGVSTVTGVRTGAVRKIFRGPGNTLVAVAGAAGDCAAFERWLQNGRDGGWEAKDKEHGFAALVVDARGEVLQYDTNGLSYTIAAPFYARGSGAELAIGAMAMGAGAEQAVEIACRYDVWSTVPVQVERLQSGIVTLLKEGG